MSLNKKNYNTTDILPEFYRGTINRDQLAHFIRWSHIVKVSKNNEGKVVDFGCGKGNLLATFIRNQKRPEHYVGIDIRDTAIKSNQEQFKNYPFAEWINADLVKDDIDFSQFQADKVISFEVIEHVGKQNADKFLENFKACGKEGAVYYLSTPNYDEKVGAAKNHTYDSGDGHGVVPQEFSHKELQKILSRHFEIVKKYGTFASVKDYKNIMNDWQSKMFVSLEDYYDPNFLAVLMAPMFPDVARNTMWVMKRKES